MPQVLERLYQDSDLPALRALWEKVYEPLSAQRREQVFSWIREQNPYAEGMAPRHLVFQGNSVVGSLGCLPVRFHLGKEPFTLHFSHDLLVDPEARGLGLGKKLVAKISDSAPGLTGGLWMTDPCYALHQRAGWTAVEPFRGQALPVDAKALLKRRFGGALLPGLLSPLASAWLRARRRSGNRMKIPFREITRFGPEVDQLFDRTSHYFGAIAQRHADYLNWKYGQAPLLDYRNFVLADDRNAYGYAVTRLQLRRDGHRNGLIIDFFADPTEKTAFETVILNAVDALAGQGAEIIYVLTTHAPFRRRLETLGFTSSPALHTFVIHGHESMSHDLDLTSPASWYLTYGDSDGDMWAEAQAWKTSRNEPTSSHEAKER